MTSVAPPVSVVIPCHNAVTWVAETIRSVLTQDVACELIVVDDGSTDGSANEARRAAGADLVLLQQPNSGVSRARNAGTVAARGEFIQYLDADDVLAPGTLAARLDALRSGRSDVAYCDYTHWERREDGSFADVRTVTRVLGPRTDVELLTDAWWPPAAVLYRRSVVERIGPWREDLPVIQDARYLLDAALSGATFRHVPGIGARYRVHGEGSLSRSNPTAFLHDVWRSASELRERWKRDGTLDDERRRGLVHVHMYLARAFFTEDRAMVPAVVHELTLLDPHYLAGQPRLLRAVSAVVGYPRAEYVTLAWRGLKRMVGA